jgi:YVTN family beta-propeller protein
MPTLHRAAALFAILVSLPTLHAQSALLVLSKADHTLAIVDATTLKVLAKAPVGDDPHEVIASTDGTRAYASNYGSGALHTLAVIDLHNRRALPSIDLGALHGPHGLTFVGGKLWFTAEGSKVLGSLDPATGHVDTVIGTGQDRTHMLWVADDLQTIVTTNVASGTVSILTQHPSTMKPVHPDWSQTLLPVGAGSEGFDLSPDHKQVWVANAENGTVAVIDLPGKKIIDTLIADVKGANRLQFTPDGKYVLVTSLSQPHLTVIDVATRRIVKRIPIGHGAAGLLVDPNGSRAFASCTPDNYVAIIDLHTFQVTGHINAGGNPDGLAWTTLH